MWTARTLGKQNVSNVSGGVKEAKVMMARDRARKASQAKGKIVTAKEKAGVAREKQVKHCNHGWKWGHMEKDCFTLAKSKGKGGKTAIFGEKSRAIADGFP